MLGIIRRHVVLCLTFQPFPKAVKEELRRDRPVPPAGPPPKKGRAASSAWTTFVKNDICRTTCSCCESQIGKQTKINRLSTGKSLQPVKPRTKGSEGKSGVVRPGDERLSLKEEISRRKTRTDSDRRAGESQRERERETKGSEKETRKRR